LFRYCLKQCINEIFLHCHVVVASGHQQMSLQIDTSDVDYELLREREEALRQLEVRVQCLSLKWIYCVNKCFMATSLHSLYMYSSSCISVTSYFPTSSKDILLSVSLPNFSCSPSLEYLCPCALILLRLWRYINHVLTYLLTYLLT